MAGSLIKDMQDDSFLLVIIDEKEYLRKLSEIVKSVEKTKTKICYVCLNTPYRSIAEQFKMVGINTKNFFFIDGVSRARHPSDELCTFVSSPSNAAELESAIKDAVEKKKCSTIVFDTISTLLVYQDSFSILNMTNNLQKKSQHIRKIFLVVKERPSDLRFIKDLGMFADKIMKM
jgi:KaiC/GvpD/RAD55 family RecA-like ATPase